MEKLDLYVRDYTETPGPRYIKQGLYSGEDFYIKKLNPSFLDCFENKKQLVIHLDGTAGYPPSFLDEAFGELVYDFSRVIVEKIVSIETSFYTIYKEQVINETYPQWERRRIKRDSIKSTVRDISVSCLDIRTGKINTRQLK